MKKRIEDKGWRIATASVGARSGAILYLLSSILSVALPAPALGADSKPTNDYLLHLPGISGYHWIDKQLLSGLQEGGFDGQVHVRDWPGDAPGLAALFARKRNDQQAQAVADAIEARARENPDGRIILTAHSGGSGILVWALEKLPDDVQVDTVLLLAPALSPGYDLSAALRHVRGKMYAFTSTLDAIVLGAGTKTFGTIDGVKGDASGRCGFVVPEGADEEAYSKLVQMPYDAKWMREGNLGDHIGCMGWRFAKNVLAPLVAGEGGPKRVAPRKDEAAAKGQAPSTAAPRKAGPVPSRKTANAPGEDASVRSTPRRARGATAP